MRLRLQLHSIVCYFSALWLLATARSCNYANNLFSSMSVTDANGQSTGRIFGELAEESEGSVCRLNRTCCSVEAQEFMQESVSSEYHNRISDMISTQLFECYSHNITGSFNQYIASNKNNLVQSMLRTFGIYFRPYVTLYDDFYAYLQETVITGNMCQLGTKFIQVFYEVFLAAYISNPATGTANNLPNTAAFRNCFYNYFLELKGEEVANWYNGFTRSFNRTMYYFRALRTADAVLESLLTHRLTNSCRSALMKMSHCAQCTGYESPTHCQGMCLNSLRGCLVDLADLAGPFREFSDAVVRMKNSLENVYTPWVQFDNLQSNFFYTVSTSFTQAADIAQGLSLRCTAVGPRIKRQAPATGDSLGTGMQIQPPITGLNQSAHCYRGLPSMFSHLPELLCGDKGSTNQNCWNGQTVGSYDREVIAFDRQAQRNNPEVLTCGQQHYRTEIRQLKAVTRELNLLSGFYTCSPDDEDCVVSLDAVCDFQAPAMTLDTDDGSGDSYSGSGADDVFEDAPSNPSIITAVSQSPMSVTFAWTQPVGETVDNYEITVSYQGPCSGVASTKTMIMNGATREQTVIGLQEFSTYTIDITAINCSGRSVTSSQNVTTAAAAPTASPRAASASATGPTSISIVWNHVDCTERNSEITGYTLHYHSADGTATNTSLPANVTSYTVTGRTPSTNYSVEVAAISSNGEVGPATFPILVETLPLASALVVNGTTIPDHGFVLLEDIGEYDTQSLLCLTNQTDCCEYPSIGDWYFPNQTTIPNFGGLWHFYNSRGPSVVRMHRRTGGVVGIYRCKIPRQDGVDTLHVGVYTTSTGVPDITSLQFQLTSELNATTPTFTLTCTSTGGPATAVSWTANNRTVTEDSAHHITSQILTDPVTATYNHTLTVTGRRAGEYECNVSNNKPSSASRRLMVVGASPPTNLSAEPAGPTSIRISWTPPASGAAAVGYWIHYQAERAHNSSVNHGTVHVGAGATQHTLTNLEQGLSYTITMVTKSQYLPSTVAGPVSAVPGPVTAQPAVIAVRVKVVNATALLVSWDALRDAHHYTIYYSAFYPELYKVVDELKIVVPSTEISGIVVIRELTVGVEHQFQVTSSVEVQGEIHESERSEASKIVFDEAAFHLQMGPVSPCTTWSTDKAEKIRSYIHIGIAKAISYHCNCSFPMEFIRNGLFRCWNAIDEFTYRSAIVGTGAHNATELVKFLEEWVNSEPALQVDQFELWVDTKCPVLISSLKLKGEGKCS